MLTKSYLVFLIFLLFALIGGGIFIYNYWRTVISFQPSGGQDPVTTETDEETGESEPGNQLAEELAEKAREIIEQSEEVITETQKFIEEEKEKLVLIALAKEKSRQVKGLYINEFVANSQSPAAFNARQTIKDLLDETELNGVVIDVKEAYGLNLPDSLKELINEFHQKDIWVVARICAFRDSSLVEESPDLYLKTILTSTSTPATTTEEVWQDSSGQHWLDPKSSQVQDYLVDFSKKVIDFGFDELQFDYVRFPSDGDVENIIYPTYDGQEEKHQVIGDFFSNLADNLRDYKPSIILSVDLFGYIATQYQALDIGQRLVDAASIFDYVSFMLYPSHFYGGFSVDEDVERGLPAVFFPYDDEDINQVVSNHPYEIVSRSIFSAVDLLSLLDSQTQIRPWLQNFNLNSDTSRGIYYDAEKVLAQIQGAEEAGASGWLLWNPSNIYTAKALNP